MLNTLPQDVRHAFRHLRRSPGFAAATVLTLALGMGANTALFSILNGVVLRELSIKDPQGLIAVSNRSADNLLRPTPITMVGELARREEAVRDVCAYGGPGVYSVEVNGTPARTTVAYLTGQCFAAFGVTPILGRGITDDDAPLTRRGAPVAAIGHGFWTRMFGADPNVIGRTLRVERTDLTIVGVMPAGFSGIQAESDVDVFAPFDTVAPAAPGRRPNAGYVLARLAPGVTLEAATAEIATLWPRMLDNVLPSALPPRERATFTEGGPRVERMARGTSIHRNRYGRTITIIFWLTVVLLLIACLNLGSLLLSRLIARGSELAVRRALGASRWRIAQQMLVENVLLSLGAAVLAVPLSYAIIVPFGAFYRLTRYEPTLVLTPDLRVLGTTAFVGLLAGVLMSALPIWIAGRQQRLGVSWDRTITGSTGRWARGLLVAQVALSVVLLVGAGLLARSLFLLQQQNLGVRTSNLLIVEKEPLPGYNDIDNVSYYSALIQRIRTIPGVREAGAARVFPRMNVTPPFSPIGFVGEEGDNARAALEVLTPGHLEAIGVPLVAGRYPAWSDTASSQQVAIVSERLARILSSDGNVVGRRVRYGANPFDQDVVVVGVVRDATLGSPRETDLPIFYRPGLQLPVGYLMTSSLSIAVEGDPASVAAGVRQALKEGGREYAYAVNTIEDMMARAPNNERVGAVLAVALAGLAALMAFIGIYALLAHAVSRRTREIGVRIAVGAEPGTVIRMVVREGLVLTVLGVVVGVPAAFLSARAIRSLMFGLTEADPVTFGAVAAFFVVIGLTAGVLPARRAARVDPAMALRSE